MFDGKRPFLLSSSVVTRAISLSDLRSSLLKSPRMLDIVSSIYLKLIRSVRNSFIF